MPNDTLFEAGAGLLKGAAATVSDTNQQSLDQQRITSEAGSKASDRVSEEAKSKQAALMALKKIDEQGLAQGHTFIMSPQVAVGLMQDDKDPSWLKMIGQPVPTGLVLGKMKGDFQMKLDKMKAPKEFNFKVGDKTVPGAMHWNEDTQSWDLQQLGEGGQTFSPTARGLDTPASRKKGAGKGSKDQLDKDKVWLKEYDANKKWLTSDEARHVKNNNPEEYKRRSAWVEDNTPKFDEVTRRLEDSGETPSPDSGGAAPSPASAPTGAGITDQDWNAVFSGTGK